MKSQTEFNVEEQKIGRYLYFINSIIIYLHVPTLPTYLYVIHFIRLLKVTLIKH